MQKFWRDKRVLVTGHTGFVGTWLCITLKIMGAQVIGFSLPEEPESLYHKIKHNLNIKSYYGNLNNKSEIEACIVEAKPDIIYHLAAFGFINECFDNPEKAYHTNVIGTFNLLNAVKNHTFIKSIVIASSDKVYKNQDQTIDFFEETSPLGGIDTYSCSKTAQDMLAQSFFQTYLQTQDINMIILRPSNILGGGDHNKKRLIPYILESLIQGNKPEIRNPNAIRPWQHILDMVDAYLKVVQSYYESIPNLYIYNVGPKKENIVSVEELVKILLRFCDTVSSYKIDGSNTMVTKIEHTFLGLSIKKIESDLGWQPKKNIQSTLYDTYMFELQKKEFGEYHLCMEQIKQYYNLDTFIS